MSLILLQNANFGRAHANMTGSTGVGYTIIDVLGSIVSPRTTVGVYQLTSGSGIYAANVAYPDGFNGQILWDCPSLTGSSGILSQSFATEEQNVQANDPKVADTWNMVTQVSGTITQISGTVAQLYDAQYGRWKIVGNQMLFFKPDNVTLIATYNLFDDTVTPTMDSVFERVKV